MDPSLEMTWPIILALAVLMITAAGRTLAHHFQSQTRLHDLIIEARRIRKAHIESMRETEQSRSDLK